MTITKNIQSALDEQIKKLQLLRDLLSDPDIARIARTLLVERATPSPAPMLSVAPVAPRKGRRRKQKRGTLKKKALEIVKKSTRPLTARDVAAAMEAEGFDFESDDKTVAVSKALRTLARATKIDHRKSGEGAKSAILYTRLP